MRQRRLCDSSVQQTLLRFLRAADPPRAKDKTRSAAKDEPSSEKRACAPAWLGALLASGPELIGPTEPPPRVPRFRGKRDEKDRDAELPWLLREAMATAVGRLVLRRPGAGGGARWSEFFFFLCVPGVGRQSGVQESGKEKGCGHGRLLWGVLGAPVFGKHVPISQGVRTRACLAKSLALGCGRKVQHFSC